MEGKVSHGSMDVGQQVELLKRQYLQLVDPSRLSLPSDPLLILPEVQAQIYTTLFQKASDVTPPDRYRFRVLKRLIDCLEQAVQNPENDVRLFLFSMAISPRLASSEMVIVDLRFVFSYADYPT